MTDVSKPTAGDSAGSKQAPAAATKNTAAPADKMIKPGSASGYETK